MSLSIDRSSWEKKSFGAMIDSITNRINNPSESGVDRYVGLEHLDPGSMTVNRWGTPDQVEATKLIFDKGDVIFGRRRAYQKKVSMVDFRGICSAHALVLRGKPGLIDPLFLPVFLSSDIFLDRAIKISVGSLSPTVNWKTLAAQEFSFPPIKQQAEIAKLFWALEEYKNILELQLNNLSLTMQSFTAAWKANHSNEMKHLSEIVEMYQPKTIMKHQLIANGKYEVHGANNLLGHYDKFNHSGKTIAIACRGATCGSVNVISGDVWITGNAMVVVPKDSSDLDYFVELLPTIDFKRAISGSAQPQITRSSLETLTVPFPESKFRLQFVEEMTLFREAKLAINEELSLFKKLRANLQGELIETI